MEQVVFPQLLARQAIVVRPCAQQEVEVGLLVVVRREVNGQTIQGVRDGQVIAHGQLAAACGQAVRLLRGAVVIGILVAEGLHEHDAVVVRNPDPLLLQDADRVFIQADLKRGRSVVARVGERIPIGHNPIGPLLHIVRGLEDLERGDEGVGEGIEEVVGRSGFRVAHLEATRHIVGLERTHVAVAGLHAVPHERRRIRQEMRPGHDGIRLGEGMTGIHEGHLEKAQVVRIEVVVQQHIVDVPEVHIAGQGTVVAEAEAEPVLQVNQLVHMHGGQGEGVHFGTRRRPDLTPPEFVSAIGREEFHDQTVVVIRSIATPPALVEKGEVDVVLGGPTREVDRLGSQGISPSRGVGVERVRESIGPQAVQRRRTDGRGVDGIGRGAASRPIRPPDQFRRSILSGERGGRKIVEEGQGQASPTSGRGGVHTHPCFRGGNELEVALHFLGPRP